MKLIFLHADKYESYWQIDTIILMEMVKHLQSTQTGLQYVSNISKRHFRDEVGFLHADKNQSFLQVDFNTGHHSLLQGDAIIDGHDEHSQSNESNKFAISLQYLQKNVSD